MKRNYQTPIAAVMNLSETDLIRTSAVWDESAKENVIPANPDWFGIPKS